MCLKGKHKSEERPMSFLLGPAFPTVRTNVSQGPGGLKWANNKLDKIGP